MTNINRIRILGEALFGPRWQNAVARALGINSRQVHRWVSGQYEPHEGHVRDLIDYARQQTAEISNAIEEASV